MHHCIADQNFQRSYQWDFWQFIYTMHGMFFNHKRDRHRIPHCSCQSSGISPKICREFRFTQTTHQSKHMMGEYLNFQKSALGALYVHKHKETHMKQSIKDHMHCFLIFEPSWRVFLWIRTEFNYVCGVRFDVTYITFRG